VGPLALRTTRVTVESLCGLVLGWAVTSLALAELAAPAAVLAVAAGGVLCVLTVRPAVAAAYAVAVLAYAVTLYVVLLLHIDALTRNA
jgi:hypothetical protein